MSALKYLGLLGGLGGGLATGAIGKHGIPPYMLGLSPLGFASGLFGDDGQDFYKKLGKNMGGGMFGGSPTGMFGSGMPMGMMGQMMGGGY